MAGFVDLSGVRGLQLATVVVSLFEFSISPLGTRWSCCLLCLFGDARMVGHVDLSSVWVEWCARVVTVL